MNNNSLIILLLTLICVILPACAIIEESEPSTSDGIQITVAGPVITKGWITQEDSLRQIIAFQTNKEYMLLHQIKIKDGHFILDMTDDDIRNLSIPDSLYNRIYEMVEATNTVNNK